jgi:hypothetical protein
MLLAQHGAGLGLDITHILIWVIVIAAAIGIMIVALRVFQVQIPAWAVQIFWIVVVAIVAIFAIRIVMSL